VADSSNRIERIVTRICGYLEAQVNAMGDRVPAMGAGLAGRMSEVR
jgi:hypothetical protein